MTIPKTVTISEGTKVNRYGAEYESYKEVLKHDVLQSGDGLPNYFSFIVPQDMIRPEEVPEKYGLYYFYWTASKPCIKEIRKPKLLHKNKVGDKLVATLHNKGYNRYINAVLKGKL